jgi:hypothetical protein
VHIADKNEANAFGRERRDAQLKAIKAMDPGPPAIYAVDPAVLESQDQLRDTVLRSMAIALPKILRVRRVQIKVTNLHILLSWIHGSSEI